MKKVPLYDWCWEQRAVAVLLGAVVLQANPFYGLEYAVKGWFFHFLEALFYVSFMTVFLLFALLSVDKLRNEEIRVEFKAYHIPKIVVCVIYAILGIILFAWVNILDRMDPVFGRPDSVSGVEVLFYIESTVFICILIWLAILIVMTIPVANSKPYIMTRFVYVGIPTTIATLSILIGIFSGTFGSLNVTSLSALYYLTLYHLYVWIMAYGYWPVQERYRAGNPREDDPIVKFDFSPAQNL